MSDERPSKRQPNKDSDARPSEPDAQARHDASEIDGFYTHGDVWLEDGNVVLVAEGTAFRVLRSILAKNSEIFRDMFKIPQPESTEMYAGCPVVKLHDSKADLRWILKTLYDSGNAQLFGQNRMLPFTAVSAMLRLGTKYQIHFLRADAIRRLEEYFPAQLSKFQNRWTTPGALQESEDFTASSIQMELAHCIPTIDLARSHDLPHLLPPAFYLCSQLSLDDIFDGHIDSDGVTWKLSKEDMKRCLEGQQHLRAMVIAQKAFIIKAKESSDCRVRVVCSVHLSRGRDQYLTVPAVQNEVNCLLNASSAAKALELCSACTRHYDESQETSRNAVWARLAELFKLTNVTWPPDGSS